MHEGLLAAGAVAAIKAILAARRSEAEVQAALKATALLVDRFRSTYRERQRLFLEAGVLEPLTKAMSFLESEADRMVSEGPGEGVPWGGVRLCDACCKGCRPRACTVTKS